MIRGLTWPAAGATQLRLAPFQTVTEGLPARDRLAEE